MLPMEVFTTISAVFSLFRAVRPFLRFLSGLLKLFPDGRLPLLFAQHDGNILLTSPHQAEIILLAYVIGNFR